MSRCIFLLLLTVAPLLSVYSVDPPIVLGLSIIRIPIVCPADDSVDLRVEIMALRVNDNEIEPSPFEYMGNFKDGLSKSGSYAKCFSFEEINKEWVVLHGRSADNHPSSWGIPIRVMDISKIEIRYRFKGRDDLGEREVYWQLKAHKGNKDDAKGTR